MAAGWRLSTANASNSKGAREIPVEHGQREVSFAALQPDAGPVHAHFDGAEMAVVVRRSGRIRGLVMGPHFLHHAAQRHARVIGIGDRESAGIFRQIAQVFLIIGGHGADGATGVRRSEGVGLRVT